MGQSQSRDASRNDGSQPSQSRRPTSLMPGGSEHNIGVRHHYRDPDPADALAFHQREAARRAEREARPRPDGSNRSFFGLSGIGSSSHSSPAGQEQRRETRQEREARRTERERAAREKERERSLKEEHVDGGYLVTQGVYIGPEDYSKPGVRQFMIERRLAPFWRGLNDHSISWTEYQLVAAARGLPIPAADEIPPEDLIPRPQKQAQVQDQEACQSSSVPIDERSPSYTSELSIASRARLNVPPLSISQPSSPGPTSSFPLRSRTKSTLASLTGVSVPAQDLMPQETQLPWDPYVDGLPLEAYLYRNAAECPICFLYYPPYLNQTRCCDQPICSECFVQIKRPDPHPPEHMNPSVPSAFGGGIQASPDGVLVSEPASCPFCVTKEFGVTYGPPPFQRGLAYAGRMITHTNITSASVVTPQFGTPSQDAPADQETHANQNETSAPRRRATSLAVNAPSVITTDKVRPDWSSKLASARSAAARRSAAATALHTAAYLMGGGGETRFGAFGRRTRREGSSGGPSGASRDLTSSQIPGPFLAGSNQGIGAQDNESGEGQERMRTRMEDLNEMMMAEAIRLSLIAEEERKRKEEKDAKKEAKKEAKANKKDSKSFLKNLTSKVSQEGTGTSRGLPNLPNDSRTSIGESSGSQSSQADPQSPTEGKGKEAVRIEEGGTLPEVAPMDPLSLDYEDSAPRIGSHLRHVSNVSSSSSSALDADEQGQDKSQSTGHTAGHPLDEPFFNYRSLASMIGDEEKAGEASHFEASQRPAIDTTRAGSSTVVSAHPDNNQGTSQDAGPDADLTKQLSEAAEEGGVNENVRGSK
ncbi:MAG: SNF1-interacting protein [Vezdaea aestivalis]|nr:MAG: SNF1-interacting protein [Vezdaea aestivalis]